MEGLMGWLVGGEGGMEEGRLWNLKRMWMGLGGAWFGM